MGMGLIESLYIIVQSVIQQCRPSTCLCEALSFVQLYRIPNGTAELDVETHNNWHS